MLRGTHRGRCVTLEQNNIKALFEVSDNMLVGHFALGFLAKRVEPQVSLGTCFLAVMAADFLWCIFMMLGLEHVQFRSGRGAANYLVASDIALSHSLLTITIWGILFALVYLWRRRNLLGAGLLFGAVVSHWWLDYISHIPDMPLAPGVSKYFGLGLWTSVWATIVVEGGLWLVGIIAYVRAARPRTRLGSFIFWPMVLLLTLAWYGNIAGLPPAPETAAIQSLIFFSLTVLWASWINRLLPVQTNPELKREA
jgi:hypothetical protein